MPIKEEMERMFDLERHIISGYQSVKSTTFVYNVLPLVFLHHVFDVKLRPTPLFQQGLTLNTKYIFHVYSANIKY